jgi:hypothetical protein
MLISDRKQIQKLRNGSIAVSSPKVTIIEKTDL